MEKVNVYYLDIVEILDIGEGSRVCIDCTDTLDEKEGLFVGNTSSGYIFVLSENRIAKNYLPRPFRINVGAIHQYIYLGENTSYLSDLKPGQKIAVYSNNNQNREITIGRIKIEKRNFLRVICSDKIMTISATLQNAESVYLEEETKGILSISELKLGDKIKCYKDEAGRHLGKSIDEYIKEI